MTVPLMVLAMLSVIGGFIGVPEVFSGEHGNQFHNWLAPIFKSAELKLALYGSHSHFEEILLMIISVIGASASIYFAYHIYTKKPSIASDFSKRFSKGYNLLWNKYFVDEVYDKTVVTPILKSSDSILWKIADNKMIDGLVNYTASSIEFISQRIRKIQTGVAQFYAVVMMVGIVLALFWIIFGR
jgi:NADH-quinone oxidoreductase subunit L